MDNFKLVAGKDDSSIKNNYFPSLVYLSSRMVYYINLNCIHNLERTAIDCWECDCDQFSGCRKANGIRDYCDLCLLSMLSFVCGRKKIQS